MARIPEYATHMALVVGLQVFRLTRTQSWSGFENIWCYFCQQSAKCGIAITQTENTVDYDYTSTRLPKLLFVYTLHTEMEVNHILVPHI